MQKLVYLFLPIILFAIGVVGYFWVHPKHEYGTLIILHGVSSSGKSSVARALQKEFAADNKPYLYIPMDGFLETVPKKWLSFIPDDANYNPPAEGVRWIETHKADQPVPHITTLVGRVIDNAGLGMMHMLPVLAEYNNNVIFEGSFLRRWAGHLKELKQKMPIYLIRINVDLAVAEERERNRRGRIGLARSQMNDPEYSLDEYDLSVDSSKVRPEEIAKLIKKFVESH